MIFENAKWIWTDIPPVINDFADFTADFEYVGGKVVLRLSAETDYIVYLNGKRILFCQFASYADEKYYDEDDITAYCNNGKNTLLITVRYEGIESACHINCGAGLIFSLECDGQELLVSDEKTLSRRSPAYICGQNRSITPQLGLTVGMNNTDEGTELRPSVTVPMSRNFQKRPVKRFLELAHESAVPMEISGHRIYDLGKEEAGYLFLKARCEKSCEIKVTFGEHLKGGYVYQIIGMRDFSLDFLCREGENYFENMFLRVGGRYLEVLCDESVEILDIGVIPVIYPLTEIPNDLSGLDQRIYDVSVRTLRLCMHTHYEDCPWREQALYVLDSRNQMLCGYYAFEETAFQRANLVFMSKGKRDDGMLELTYPAIKTPAIPFFSVMYPFTVWEYVKHTGDSSIVAEVKDTMIGIMDRLYSWRDETGLIRNQGKPYWNFYEWSEGSNGHGKYGLEGAYDLMINCAFVYSCTRLRELCPGLPNYDLESMKDAIVKTFYNEGTGIFKSSTVNGVENVLGNTFAVLIGLGDERTYKAICGDGAELVPITLSMKGYMYDAILSRDTVHGAEFVLDDIRKTYSYMLDMGATSFWETMFSYDEAEDGWSLCHGWSAMPVYYFNKLLLNK